MRLAVRFAEMNLESADVKGLIKTQQNHGSLL